MPHFWSTYDIHVLYNPNFSIVCGVGKTFYGIFEEIENSMDSIHTREEQNQNGTWGGGSKELGWGIQNPS